MVVGDRGDWGEQVQNVRGGGVEWDSGGRGGGGGEWGEREIILSDNQVIKKKISRLLFVSN